MGEHKLKKGRPPGNQSTLGAGRWRWGIQPRPGGAETREKYVSAAREAVAKVTLDHPQRERIVDAFVEIYREMEGDGQLDGACHIIAGLAHIVLGELAIENKLCIGEIRHGLGGLIDTGGSHSWVEIGGITFDVSMARPMQSRTGEPPRAAVLGGFEIPSGKKTTIVYGTTIELDPAAMMVLGNSIGDYVDGMERATRVDFWGWAQEVCRRLGIEIDAATLRSKYKDARRSYEIRE